MDNAVDSSQNIDLCGCRALWLLPLPVSWQSLTATSIKNAVCYGQSMVLNHIYICSHSLSCKQHIVVAFFHLPGTTDMMTLFTWHSQVLEKKWDCSTVQHQRTVCIPHQLLCPGTSPAHRSMMWATSDDTRKHFNHQDVGRQHHFIT